AVGNVEIDVVERGRLDGVGSVSLGQAVHRKHCLFLSQSPELKFRWSLSVRPLYEEVITLSPGLSPLSTSMKSLLRRPSWTERFVAPLPPLSTTKTQLPPLSVKKAPFGIIRAREESPTVSLAWIVWPRCIDCGSGPMKRRSIWNWPLRACGDTLGALAARCLA